MQRARDAGHTVDPKLLGTAIALLIGVLLLATGHFQGSKLAFYGGLLLTIAGVLRGALQLVVQGNQ